MSEYLFTYGTLQPGLAPQEMVAAVDTLRPVGEGFVHGVLYDLGHYPGAVLDPLSEHKIFGTVFRMPEDANVLRQLDDYEEFYPDCPEASQFVRSLCKVVMAGGEMLDAWIYVYNRRVDNSLVLADGRFGKAVQNADLD